MISLLVAVVLLFTCCAFYIFFRRGRHGGLAGGSGAVLPPFTPSAGTDEGRLYTESEIERHNRQDDLWLIINGKVYDFTEYVALHPGGEAIMRNAGRDSTAGFSGSQHPPRVWDLVR